MVDLPKIDWRRMDLKLMVDLRVHKSFKFGVTNELMLALGNCEYDCWFELEVGPPWYIS